MIHNLEATEQLLLFNN